VVALEVWAPEAQLGDVTGALATRRAKIAGTDGGSDSSRAESVVRAQVPQAELEGFAAELKSLTAGKGRYALDFSHYEPVPPNVQQKLVEGWKPKPEEDGGPACLRGPDKEGVNRDALRLPGLRKALAGRRGEDQAVRRATGARETSSTPPSTSTGPATCQAPIGSSSSSRLSTMVETGPSMPICEAWPEPTREIPSITSSTGATVHSVPLASDSQYTSAGRANADNGRSSRNWPMHSRQATELHSAVSRTAPTLPTSSPLPARYSA